jgi:drug/metabolite transporter (DMT)-like permease
VNVGPILLALLSAALFGSATPVSKLLLRDFTAFQLSGLLYLGAAIGMLPLALRRRATAGGGGVWRYDRRSVLRLAGAVFFGGCLGPVLLMLGLSAARSSSVSLWLNFELAATAVLGVLFFKDHLDARGWFGAGAMLLAGVVVAAGEGIGGALPAVLVGLACTCWAIDNHLTALIDGITPAQSTLVKGLAAGTANLVLGVLLQPRLPGAGAFAGALALGAVSYGGSIALYITAAQSLGATRSQVIFASAPFFGLVLSLPLLGERMTWSLAAAVPLIVVGIALMHRSALAHRHSHAALEHVHFHRHGDGHHGHGHPGTAAGQPDAGAHVHWHVHEATGHDHAHVPDLHHRHDHDD